jgi:hypothetical protein
MTLSAAGSRAYLEDQLRFAKLDQERLDAAKEHLRRLLVEQARRP